MSDQTLKTEQAVKKHLSSTELARLESTGSINKRREFLLSRSLMRHALSQHFFRPESEWLFLERLNLPPLISHLPESIHFSLSHSKNLICFALSSCQLGIDIEDVNKQRDFGSLAKNFLHDDDLKGLEIDPPIRADQFYQVWCAKEAFYKALPPTEQSKATSNKFHYSRLAEGAENWLLIEGSIERFRLALVVKNQPGEINSHYFKWPGKPAKVTWQESNDSNYINQYHSSASA